MLRIFQEAIKVEYQFLAVFQTFSLIYEFYFLTHLPHPL